MEQLVLREIIEEIKSSPKPNIALIKNMAARRHGLEKIPSNSEILRCADVEELPYLIPLLRRKPIRTLSGVAVVAAMTKPQPCPGSCIYCPRGEDAPQSYTGEEPATLRARWASYDPHLQVAGRLEQLECIGHPVEKVELIIMGGTFPAQPRDYQRDFIKGCFDALNARGGLPISSCLEEAHGLNEKSTSRNVGVTVETRPDFARREHVDDMLAMGVTRVELGVQTLDEAVYERVKRGHSLEDVARATRILKDAGLKVGYHMMPGLFADLNKDFEMFQRIFHDPDFRPDSLKIYPTLVLRDTGLYELWSKGEFRPYSEEEAMELICKVKEIMPKWIRTMRIQRDIPARLIVAGVKKGDLGELVRKRLDERGKRCRCIRCRDAGHLVYREGIEIGDITLLEEEYDSSLGKEVFISAEDLENDALVAYLRLRFPHEPHRTEIAPDTSLVRELKVLGQALRLGERADGAGQHQGLGESLLERAEEISCALGMRKILVTSAVGTREYYRKFGYERVGCYVGKKLA